MTRQREPPNERRRFEIGDEVIGDEHIGGIIVKTNDAQGHAASGQSDAAREYLVQNDKGEMFLYGGETNLRLIKKGLGDAAPPRPELLKELEKDLRHRPLAGLRP